MKKKGVVLVKPKGVTVSEKKSLEKQFMSKVFPALTPLAIDPAHPFPFIPTEGSALALKLRNKDGMGLGDAKLLSVIGFWFGWISIPFVIFFSSAVALISVIPDLIKNKKKLSSQIPFGPFLIIGCLIFLFLNEQIKLFLN